MFCGNCGKPVADNAKFCGSCGKPVNAGSFCPSCGAQASQAAEVCVQCGTRFNRVQTSAHDVPPPQHTPPPQYTPPPPQYTPPAQPTIVNAATPPASTAISSTTGFSPKSKTTAALLAFFLGTLGIHRFYAGKIATGIVMLALSIIGYVTISSNFGYFPLAAVGIWVLIDFIMILAGKFRDGKRLLIK